MRFKIVCLILFLFSHNLFYSQGEKEFDIIFEEQLLNVQYPAEQYINTGEYLLKISKTNIQKAQAYFLIAQGQNQLRDIEKSIQNVFWAKKIANDENDVFLSCYAEIILKRYCTSFGMYDKAKFYLSDVKRNAESINDKRKKAIIQSIILEDESRDLLLSWKISQAISLLKKQESLCLKNNLPEIFMTGNRNLLGSCYLKIRQIDLAEQYFKKSLSVLSKNNISSNCFMKFANYGLACIYLLKKDDLAKKYLLAINHEMVCKLNYEVLWIKELLPILRKFKPNETAFYENQLNEFEIFEIENKRVGRNVMLSLIENEAHESSFLSQMFSSKGIWFLSLLFVIIISLYIYNVLKYKKEYAQFKRIMHDSSIKTKAADLGQNLDLFDQEQADILKDNDLSMNQKSKEAILDKLNDFESSQLFLKQDISLEKLSKYVDANSKYVREIIQKYKSKNYSSYINELRINYVIDLLKNNPKFLNYKVSYLAEISGFSSHSAFSVVFRSISGLSPNQFIEFLKKEKSLND